VSFVTRGRGARLITGQDHEAAPATGSHERVPVRAA
jgi:hypothetical protein